MSYSKQKKSDNDKNHVVCPFHQVIWRCLKTNEAFMNKLLIFGLIFSKLSFAGIDLKSLEVAKKNCRQGVEDKSVILETDRAEDLVEDASKMIFNLEEMESLNLMAKNLSVAPWSDSYWPLYAGALAYRYNDPSLSANNWKEARDYVSVHSAKELIAKGQLSFLSPAEKYDFLVGLGQDNLTKSNWAEGEEYYREYGKVETWMGLCHGWSAASMMMPNPVKRVEVKTNEGPLVFNPSDIKGLATLLWAKGEFQSRFVGGRCNSKGPKVDSMGRPIEIDCLDNNPGTWHLAIVNQIGVFDRSFVMDATYDYQVWNQPVYSYSYTYYNPKTKKSFSKLADAIVSLNEWNNDPRRGVRAVGTKSIVGIRMQVAYVTENSPSVEENQDSQFSTVNYEYDLELNAENKIIGGEWYSTNHPDFLWVADVNAFPETYGDAPNLKIDLNNISPRVKKAAAENAKYELPYGPIVRELFKASAE